MRMARRAASSFIYIRGPVVALPLHAGLFVALALAFSTMRRQVGPNSTRKR